MADFSNNGFRSAREGRKASDEKSPSKFHLRIRDEPDKVPSEISSDEWGEVVRYQKVLDEEARAKEREDYIKKQQKVRQTLEEQIKKQSDIYREQGKDKIKEQKKQYLEQSEDQIPLKAKQYYEQHKDNMLVSHKQYYEDNK